ncbi:hypothetical protein IT397_01255 [Candidatus Nomurabacteria bacterium]|nr:hypothetical protein [Candidatus Nomurabacteria bacterium]
MKISLRGLLIVSIFAIGVLINANVAMAAPSLTSTTTVANTGVSNQSAVTSTTTANVVEVKAKRTFTVASVPADDSTLIIGSGATKCTITFNTAAVQDIDCSDSTAAINTTTDDDATKIATRLISLTDLTTLNHGSTTPSASSTSPTSVVFTTTNTETSATAITATDNAAITTAHSVVGVIPVAQVNTLAISGDVEVGDVYTVTAPNGIVSYTVQVADTSTTTIAASLNTALQATSTYAGATYTTAAVSGNGKITFTAKSAGTALVQTSSATNVTPVAQVVTFTPADTIGNLTYNYVVTINSTDHTYSFPGGASTALVLGISNSLAGDSDVTCTQDGTTITCTAKVPGTAFTYSTAVTAATVTAPSSSSRGGGGGGNYVAPTIVITTVPNDVLKQQLTAQLISVLKQLLQELISQLNQLQAGN